MRVLYLTDSLSALDGVGRYAVRLITALERLEPGLEVRILLARKHRPTSSAVPKHWRVEVALPPDYFFHMSPPRFWPSLLSAVWRISRAARGVDLVHAIKDYPHNYAGLLGARRAHVPCIATAHGTYSVQPLLDPRHERRARWTYRHLDGLIAVSRYTARRLEELLPPADLDRAKLSVIPNCVDAEHYRAPRKLVGERPWRNVTFTLGIGELKERKGHHLALAGWVRAAARHPELHHFIVGKLSDGDYRESLLEICRRAGMETRVHFLGNVEEEEKIDLLQRARAFVHTPVTSANGGFEGFGIVYLEAAACGVPCIGTLDCGAEDAIVDRETGFLVEPTAQAVERALDALLADEALRSRMGAAGREYARSQSWDHNAARVLEIYRAAIAAKGRAMKGAR